MKRSFFAGLALALGALGVLAGVALSQEKPADQPSVNQVVINDVEEPVRDVKAD